MVMTRMCYRALVAMLASVFVAMSIWLPAAQAEMIGTDAVAGADEVEVQRDEILMLLEREEVREQLVAWGVDPADAEARVEALTPAELQALSERMEEDPAGAGVGSIVGAALIIFLVLLITDILGYTSVFPFVDRTAQ